MNNDTNQQKLIQDAQWRKGMSIAYFNSLNASISLVTAQGTRFGSEDEMLESINKYKNHFIEQHNMYYTKNIAPIGVQVNIKGAIAKAQEAKTLEELKAVWLKFSELERQNPEIKSAVNILKETYKVPTHTIETPKVLKNKKAVK